MNIDDVDIHDIYDFMENGTPANAPAHIVKYLDLLDKARGMHLRIDQFGSSEAIIKHLMVSDNLSRYKAKQLYNEALEYFYCDNTISKTAYRNIYADKIDKMINFSMQIAKDVSDAGKVVKMIVDAAKVRALDEPDKEELPDELFKQPIKLYTADAKSLGMPETNRNQLKAFIENMPELTEKEKQRLLQEADITPFKIFPNEQEDPRKS
jgi:hypothetical protein